ncbi:hypothetical protein TWF173_010554 [Orbilia oligospora]|nr:hypothetical protein TWF173_010554 [Orbilia oligospora]KAF3309852.1 hypothetical protein TWF173_010554 [Orbilia oligospora]
MESPLRRSIIDTSLFPQPPSRNRPAIASFGSPAPGAASGYRTPTQSFFRQSTSSTSSSAPYSPPRHSKERSFSTATGHSKTSSSDSRSHLTSLSSRSSLYSEDNDFDSIDSKIKSPLTIATSITSSAESPVDPYFKIHHHSAPPKSPVLELFRSQLADKSASTTNNRWSLDLFSAPLHASRPGSPRRHPLQQNLSSSDIDVDTSRNNKFETQRGSVVATDAINTRPAEQKHTRAYPSISSLIEEPLGRLSRAFSMPHVITQQAPGLPNQSMLNRSNSTNTESSFNPRTPARTKTGFGSLFGWGASSIHEDSPIERPVSLAEQRMSKLPSSIDVTLANSQPSHPKRTDSGISLPPRTPISVEEVLEEELRSLSADLAASIRREVELEDLVETLQLTAESQGKLSPGVSKRTSDYFSDAGTGSGYDFDLPSKEQLDYDRVVRKSEQVQTQIRLELTQKIQEERQRRKGVELQVRELEERVGNVELGGLRPPSPGRVRDLEVALDDARRKLSEERNLKANFEDLVTAIKDELTGYRNERDNLRDEIVPHLRARVEGLEAELAESQKNPYDATKMQQEIDDLRTKYTALVESSRQIQQEKPLPAEPPVVQTPTQPATPVNTTFKEKDSLVERIKEIELQRDALQDGLRNLRLRNELENKKALHRIRTLEWERDRAMRPSFRRMRKNKEIATFKSQVERLRHRAENAIDSKYVCERNLSSLRLDLDRLEQEMDELRELLKTQDTLANQVEELQESCKQLLAECEGDAELEQLSTELRSRSVSNAMLRKRLVDAIERGDQDRLMANTKINALCELLKSMEEKIGEAQQDLEDVASKRDQEARDLKEAKGGPRLRRVDEQAAMDVQPNSALIAAKEPRISRDGRGKDTRLYVLQHRIEQLEKTITTTDIEMEDLESRLNMTLLEASELRTENDQSSLHVNSLRLKLSRHQS